MEKLTQLLNIDSKDIPLLEENNTDSDHQEEVTENIAQESAKNTVKIHQNNIELLVSHGARLKKEIPYLDIEKATKVLSQYVNASVIHEKMLIDAMNINNIVKNASPENTISDTDLFEFILAGYTLS